MTGKFILTTGFFLGAMLMNTPMAQENSNITITTRSGLVVQMGGEIEMEFVDVEGKGGFSHRDLTYQKVKTRSPQMKMDKAVLSATVK